MKYLIAWMIDWRPSWPLLHDRTKTIKRRKAKVTSATSSHNDPASLNLHWGDKRGCCLQRRIEDLIRLLAVSHGS
jgi:hypothetical protein